MASFERGLENHRRAAEWEAHDYRRWRRLAQLTTSGELHTRRTAAAMALGHADGDTLILSFSTPC
jgi:hypothetical protein